MNLRNNSKSSLFLIELIIVILFFAIAGAICVSLFSQSRLMSIESTELTMATQKCQNAAELLAASGGDVAQTAHLLGEVTQSEGLIALQYDLEGQPQSGGRYALQITYGPDENLPSLLQAAITMTDTADMQPIYTLETAVYKR